MFNIFKSEKKEPENLKQVLDELKKTQKQLEIVANEMKNLKEKTRFAVQKTGMIRFNPFNAVGGNQSFSAAFLDANDNGVVITSLFTREGNRVYGKPIQTGKSEYPLSEEEKAAIQLAKNSQTEI